MRELSTDVVVIGAGTAGLSARREAVRAGARTLLVEEGLHGTTCARVGCMPSKLLIAAADAAHAVACAPRFGIEVPGGARANGPAVLERVRRERDRFVGAVLEAVEAIPQDERLSGHARFVGPTTLTVDDHTRVKTRAVVVATGSAPWIPEQLEGLKDALLVSDDVFELPDLPRTLAVFGAGIVALELGQALARLGVRTAFFSPSAEVGPFTDPDLIETAHAVLGEELSLHLGVDYRVSRSGDKGFQVAWRAEDGAPHEAVFEKILCAAGRRPRLEGLDLQAAGLPLDARGLPQFDASTLRCGDLPIFIAGDANDQRPFLHEASDEGSIAGRNAASPRDAAAHPRRTPLSIVFTDPQMALVGKSFVEIEHEDVAVGSVSYANQGRARVLERNQGLVRIYADRGSRRILGAEMFGPAVEHTAHLLAWAIQAGLRVDEAHALPFYHPVLEEGLRTALRDLCSRLAILCESRPRDLEYGPGA